MKHQFLTLTSCFQGIFLNGIESIFVAQYREPSIPETYRLIRWIKQQGGDNVASVGLFEDQSGERVILKHLQYRWKNLAYRQILNEASLLELFAGWSYLAKSGRTVSFPTLCEVKDFSGELILVKKFEEGEMLDVMLSERQAVVVADCLDALRSLTSSNQLPIGERTAWEIGLSFPLYWLRVFWKTPKHARFMVSLFVAFYRHWLGTLGRVVVVTHGDLYAKNILVNDQRVFILDLESMVLCPRETELALVTRFNHQHWGDVLVRQMLTTDLDTEVAKQSYAALSIYYAVQIMVTDRTTGPYYEEALNYLTQYKERLVSLAL